MFAKTGSGQTEEKLKEAFLQAKDSEGLTAHQIDELKLRAVWRFADRFQSGLLEPWEINRLAQAVPACGLGGRMRARTSQGRNKRDPMYLWAQKQAQKRLGHTHTVDTAGFSSDESNLSLSDDASDLTDLSSDDEDLNKLRRQDRVDDENEAKRHWHYQAMCR